MKQHRVVCVFLGFILAFGLASPLFAQKAKPKPRPRAPINITSVGSVTVYGGETPIGLTPARQKRWDSFLKVWQTLEDNYFDRTFNGLDWDKIKAEYRPRVLTAATDAQLHAILNEMVQRLDRSHFAITPPEFLNTLKIAKRNIRKSEHGLKTDKTDLDEEELEEDDIDESSMRFGIGVELRVIDEKFVITSIDEGSAAQLAGIKAGYIVDKINGVSMTDIATKYLASYPYLRDLRRYLPVLVSAWFLNGEKDTSLTVTCLDGSDKPRDFVMTRQRLLGEAVSIGSNYPEQFVRYETRAIGPDIGYIKFNLFSFDIIGKVCDSLTRFKDKKAIIVDLRGNLGGLLASLIGVSGMFTDRPLDLGTTISRKASTPLSVSPKNKRFLGRLVVLVDDQTVSAAELFASGMQENDRVLVVGSKTAGAALPAASVPLATGATFLFPIANFKSKKGNYIEGKGLTPNYAVALDRGSLLSGADPQMERALSLIREDKAFPVLPAAAKADVELPPPPKPKTSSTPIASENAPPPTMRLSTLPGYSAPPPSKALGIKDEKAVKIISDFLKLVDINAFKQLRSYHAAGSGTLGIAGSKTPVSYIFVRQFPDKYSMVINTGSAGEIREVHDGAKGFVDSDYGYEQDLSLLDNASRSEILAPIMMLDDLSKFTSLSYTGTFDREGRKSHIIEGRLGNEPVALAFDVLTGTLVSFAGYGPPVEYGDYRKTGTVTLPFHIEILSIYSIDLEDFKFNEPIDEANFKKKERCFDKP